jgi:hypothetical protein
MRFSIISAVLVSIWSSFLVAQTNVFYGKWNMDQINTDTVFDGNNNFNGIVVGGYTEVPGYIGNGISLNSDTLNPQYVIVDNKNIPNPPSISIDFYAKFDQSNNQSDYRLLFKEREFDVHLWLKDPKGASLRFMLGTHTMAWRDIIIGRPTNIFDGKFHHIAFSYNALNGEFIAYWDDKVLNIVSIPNDGTNFANSKLYIGAGYWGNAPQQLFKGAIDEITVRDTVINFDPSIIPFNYVPDTLPLGDKIGRAHV